MNIKNINNIVFYKKVVNGMEMKAACIFGKDGSIKHVPYKEGIKVCTELAKELNITSKNAFKEMINNKLVHVTKFSELKKDYNKYLPREYRIEKKTVNEKPAYIPITEEEKKKNPDLKDTFVLDPGFVEEMPKEETKKRTSKS